MSDVQKTDASPEPTRDNTLAIRRLLAFVISSVLGLLVVALGIILYLKTDLLATIPLSGLFPNVPLLFLAAIPMALFFLIWIDYFMGTHIVSD
jgi:hypothetical protein